MKRYAPVTVNFILLLANRKIKCSKRISNACILRGVIVKIVLKPCLTSQDMDKDFFDWRRLSTCTVNCFRIRFFLNRKRFRWFLVEPKLILMWYSLHRYLPLFCIKDLVMFSISLRFLCFCCSQIIVRHLQFHVCIRICRWPLSLCWNFFQTLVWIGNGWDFLLLFISLRNKNGQGLLRLPKKWRTCLCPRRPSLLTSSKRTMRIWKQLGKLIVTNRDK